MEKINLYSVDYSSHGEAFEWSGEMSQFIIDNQMESDAVWAMIDDLAKSNAHYIGGGTAPLFLVKLA